MIWHLGFEIFYFLLSLRSVISGNDDSDCHPCWFLPEKFKRKCEYFSVGSLFSIENKKQKLVSKKDLNPIP